jgi:hypothetical protein
VQTRYRWLRTVGRGFASRKGDASTRAQLARAARRTLRVRAACLHLVASSSRDRWAGRDARRMDDERPGPPRVAAHRPHRAVGDFVAFERPKWRSAWVLRLDARARVDAERISGGRQAAARAGPGGAGRSSACYVPRIRGESAAPSAAARGKGGHAESEQRAHERRSAPAISEMARRSVRSHRDEYVRHRPSSSRPGRRGAERAPRGRPLENRGENAIRRELAPPFRKHNRVLTGRLAPRRPLRAPQFSFSF